MKSQRCFVIAEAGVNHNGDIGRALEMVDVAAEAGADAIKFQSFKTQSLVMPGTRKAEYQVSATGDGDMYSMIERLEIDEAAHLELQARCQSRRIEFMSSPFDDWSLDLLLRLPVQRLKLASGEIVNKVFLQRAAASGLPLIMSTGMSTLEEVRTAIDWVSAARTEAGLDAAPETFLTVLHCTSNYPAAPEDVHLRAMLTMRDEFQVPVGYSDHTLGLAVSTAAVALGATVIEKHFTLDRGLPGPDHQASLDPQQLHQLVTDIRTVSQALGSAQKRPTDSELPVRDLVRRSLVANRAVSAGAVLGPEDVIALRPGTGIPAQRMESYIGRTAARDIQLGAMLSEDDFR